MIKNVKNLVDFYIKHIKNSNIHEQVAKKVNFLKVENGYCKAELKIEPEHTNILGKLHGGFSTSLIDIISSMALLRHECKGQGVSIAINASYLRTAEVGDEIIIEANTIKVGKNLAYLEVEIKDKNTGKLIVTGTHTKYIG